MRVQLDGTMEAASLQVLEQIHGKSSSNGNWYFRLFGSQGVPFRWDSVAMGGFTDL